MELNLKLSPLGMTEIQKEEVINKYKNMIKDYFNWVMVDEIDKLAEDLQKEMNREIRQIKLDNILKDEFHQKNFEEGKNSQQSR
jgi:hypothetical protein